MSQIWSGKKTVQVAVEQDTEVRRILQKAATARHVDLEAWETALRAAVLSAGARALEGLLEGIGSGKGHGAVVCKCGSRMGSQGLRNKELLTILGPVTYGRSMFQCPVCQGTRYPGDEELDIVETTRSPGVRRMLARAGSQSTFKEGHDDLRIYADGWPKGSANRWNAGPTRSAKRFCNRMNRGSRTRPFLSSMSATTGQACR